MAKQSNFKNGTSRVRFVMLEAEVPDGDLSQITSAIQNALRPAATIIQQRLPPPAAVSLPSGVAEAEADSDHEDDHDEAAETSTPNRLREARPRKPPSMKVLGELDLTSDRSFESFANEHVPSNDTERHLVALAWFKEHRPSELITANHVYSCYRIMKWPSGLDDFPSVLRSLKKKQLVNSVGRGQYEINYLGVARVEKMSSAS